MEFSFCDKFYRIPLFYAILSNNTFNNIGEKHSELICNKIVYAK